MPGSGARSARETGSSEVGTSGLRNQVERLKSVVTEKQTTN